MKSILLLIIIVIIPFQTFGQLEQGTFLLGGGLSASSTHDEYSGDFYGDKYEIDKLSFSFYPEIGYIVIDNLALGLIAKIETVGFTYQNNSSVDPETNSDSFEYLLGPYIRYYYPIKPFAIFAELNYQFGNKRQTIERYLPDNSGQYNLFEIDSEQNVSLFSSGIGVEYFINKSIGLSAAVRYENGKREYSSEDAAFREEYYYEQKNYGFVFLVGLQIHLNFDGTN